MALFRPWRREVPLLRNPRPGWTTGWACRRCRRRLRHHRDAIAREERRREASSLDDDLTATAVADDIVAWIQSAGPPPEEMSERQRRLFDFAGPVVRRPRFRIEGYGGARFNDLRGDPFTYPRLRDRDVSMAAELGVLFELRRKRWSIGVDAVAAVHARQQFEAAPEIDVPPHLQGAVLGRAALLFY